MSQLLFKSSDATRLSSWWSKHHVRTLVKLGQHHIRIYLSLVFAKELTKLLSKLKSSLKDHFNGVELQMRVARGDDSGGGGPGGGAVGWQTFFDAHAWRSAIEVEGRSYYMAPNSCVLALYVGHVRSLRNSLDPSSPARP